SDLGWAAKLLHMTSQRFFLGIETGGTKILARIVTGVGALVDEARWPTTTPAAAEAAILAFVGDRAIAGIGIAAFGPVVVDAAAANYGEVLATPKPRSEGRRVGEECRAREATCQ